MNTLRKHLNKMNEVRGNLPELQQLYFDISHSYGMLTDEMSDVLVKLKQEKLELWEEVKSVSEFDRLVHMSDSFDKLQEIQNTLKAFEKMLPGIKVLIDSYRESSKGQY